MQHVSFFQRTHLLLAGWFTLLTLVGQAQFSQLQKITANPRQTDATFGNRVAIDGDVMVVGASQETGGGAAYVFERVGSTWQQTARLVSSDRAFADDFGHAVAVSGTTIVVGANLENEDASGGNTLANAGSAYVFEKSGGTWSQTQKLVASDRGVDEYFGIAVGISGNTIVVGAIWEAQDASGGNTLAKAGAAYVFGKSGSTWSQTQKLVASDRSASDTFGYSVAVSGTTIVVGAIFDDHDASGGNPLSDAGSAYVFEKSGSTWSQTRKLVASDRGAFDEFGYSVAITGNTIVVGAFWEDQDASGGNPLGEAGAAYVFDKSGSTWSQTQKLVASDRSAADQFGIFVGISGTTIVVGANYDAQNASGGGTLNYAGSAYVFDKSGSTWSQTQKLVASDRGQDDYFGISVGISGNTIVVGAFFEDQDASGGNTLSKAGSVYVFGTCDAATASTPTLGATTICQGSSTSVSATYGGSASSGSFSDGGKGGAFSVSTSGSTVSGTYTPAASYSGSVTITFSTNDPDGSGGCAAATSTASLTVNAAATATTPTLGSATICQGSNTSVSASFGGSATSGSFSDGGKGGSFSVSTSGSTVSGTYTPAASYLGMTTITFTTSDPDGPCATATSTVGLTVNPAATASAVTVGTSPICQGGSTSVSASFGGSATSGSFSDGGKGGTFSVSTSGSTVSGTYTPAASYSGTTTITFTTSDPDGPCVAATSTASLTVNPAATATTPTLGATTICQGGSTSVSASFGGSATSGSFSDGGKGGAFSVSTSGSTVSGTYTPAASYSGTTTITFSTNNPDGPCPAATSTASLTVNPLATASAVTLGTSTICQGSNTTVSASFGGSASSGSVSDGGAGGSFSVTTSDGVVSGTYTPAASYSGTITITFSTNDPDGSGSCTAATSTASLTVNAAATATTLTLGSATICQGGNVSVRASFGGGANQGSFSDGGAGGSFSVTTSDGVVSGTYTPAASYSGTITITFSTNDPDGPCPAATSTATLTVNPLATASTPTLGTSPICQGSSVSVSANFGGSASSGSFSDGEAGGNFNVSTNGKTVSGTYTPAASYSGPVTITFATNDPDGGGPCGAATSTGSLTVDPAATASAITMGASAICQNTSTSVSATVGGSATGGTFSDGEKGGTFSVTTLDGVVSGTYAPPLNYAGPVTITFTTSNPDGPCEAVSSTASLTVNALPVVSLSALAASYCQNAGASSPGTPAGGSYVLDGGSPVASFNPASLTTGSHSVVYTYTSGDGCSASATASVLITQPVFTQHPSVATSLVVCANRTVSISFQVNCPTNASFTAELSNSLGAFDTGIQSLGPVTPGGANVLTIPALTSPTSVAYRIRVVGSNPTLVSNPTGPFRINALEFNSTPTVSLTAVCVGSVVKVGFTVQGNCGFLPGNAFIAELHHASLSDPLNLGEIAPGLNEVVIPRSVAAGSGYRIRIRATAPGQVSALSAAFSVSGPAFSSTPTVSLDNKCAGEAVRLSFAITSCAFPAGNGFTAQLSDKSGSFANPVSVGTVSPGGLNSVKIPANTPVGTGYKLRVVSSNPEGTSAVSGNFKVKACGTNREVAPSELGLQVRVSPNPSPEGRLRIAVSGAEGQALRVELFNGVGQTVREENLVKAAEEEILDWDISRQPGGLYLLRVSNGREARMLKVLH